MAHRTLTNPKIISSLGPNRSILGTIIRPDPVLIERIGGSSGQVMTFDSLLPGAGEPLELQNDQREELFGNWSLDYEEEEPLPRGNSDGHVSGNSSGKKRKASREKYGKKKFGENGEVRKVRNEEKRRKKKRHSFHKDNAFSYDRFVGSASWGR